MLRSRTNRGTVNANHDRSVIGPNPRILVVDGETPQVQALCRVLPDQGYAPIGFTSGEAALAGLRRGKCDLLVDGSYCEGTGIGLSIAARIALPFFSNDLGRLLRGRSIEHFLKPRGF